MLAALYNFNRPCNAHHLYYYYYYYYLFVAVKTIDGTGISGGESISFSSSESRTIEIVPRMVDETCELDEKIIQMAIYDQSNVLVSSTVNITIHPDTQCGKPFFPLY